MDDVSLIAWLLADPTVTAAEAEWFASIDSQRFKDVVDPAHIAMLDPRADGPASSDLKFHPRKADDNGLSHAERYTGFQNGPFEWEIALLCIKHDFAGSADFCGYSVP